MVPLKIEFLNLNENSKLDPEIKPLKLSQDRKNMPPSYCLPWVEAARYSIQIKSNENYIIKCNKNGINAWIERGKKKIPCQKIFLKVPSGVHFVAKNQEEAKEKKILISKSPSFSSPWQFKKNHSVTLKVGICWWTPPGWGLFFTSAVHRNEQFRIVEGIVRTDLWHRDIPIIVRPLVKELKIRKFSTLATALVVPAQDIQLVPIKKGAKKKEELINQISTKRIKPSIYKELVLNKR